MNLTAYLHRIGCHEPVRPTLDMLRDIARGHARSIPFENLDPWLGRMPSLALDDLEAKLIAGGRGGYCFEHNTLLLAALREIGFQVTPLAARVLWRRTDSEPSLPRTHMLLRVELEGQDFLADAGFGGLTLTDALRFIADEEQAAGSDRMRLVRRDAEWQLEIRLSGQWTPLYRFDLQAQLPADQRMANYFVATHPASQFVNDLIAARATPGGRLALRNRDLSFYPPDGEPERRDIGNPDELYSVLTEDFGINLEGLDGLESRLAGLFS